MGLVDDQESAIYGTVGYQAPEVAAAGPSVASDIYTIGRTLVVLCMEFKGYQSTYLSSLPDPESTPLFRDNDSLYCLVAKCCATDPADRFQSADELRVQLLGVLREVVAKKRAGTAITSAASQLFETRHPVVRVHPETGERSLVLGNFVKSFDGFNTSESTALYHLLQNRITRLENTIRWTWQHGDVAMWDNRATMHRARRYAAEQPRDLHRTTVADAAPTLEQAA